VLAHTHGYNIVSDGIVSGSIQVPGSGQPIVLMRDYQTIGGYPKIATVISPDISRLGRRSPGGKVRFAKVRRDEAEAIYREEEAAIAERVANLREARDEASLNIEALYDENLIGGIVNARE
jgi:allophanate hydrolase subunit 2